MTTLRTKWLAGIGAGLLLTLSVSSAFAAHPETAGVENHGQQVSAFVHSLLLGSDEDPQEEPTQDEQQDEQQDLQSEEEVTDEQPTEDAPNSHGKCVSEMARGTDVGGPNENHGGAVSQAARVDCWQTDTEESTNEEPPTEVSSGPGHSSGSHGKNK